MSVFGTIASGIINGGLSVLNNQFAQELAEQDRRENYMYGEMAAENADRRTRMLYGDFYSPEALMKQYKEAGLSPGMMFGGTPGQGGMSGAQGTGAHGIQTPYMPISLLDAAQAAALTAQAEKTKAETKQIEPTATASIQKMLAEAGHAKASAKVAEAEEAGIKLDNYVKEHTKEASIYMICEQAEEAGNKAQLAFEEMRSAKVLANINEATLKEQIEIKRKELEQITQSIVQSKSLVQLQEQQKTKIYNDILGMWDDLDRKWKELDVSQQQTDTYTEWINSQIPNIEKQLDIRLKELGIEKTKLIVDAVTGTIKSIAFGAMAAASFQGGKGSLQQPEMPKTTPSQPFN